MIRGERSINESNSSSLGNCNTPVTRCLFEHRSKFHQRHGISNKIKHLQFWCVIQTCNERRIMRQAVLLVLAFALTSCLQGPAGQDGVTLGAQVATIPSLNIWMGSLDSTHHAHILVEDKRYYDPLQSGSVKVGGGASAIWKAAAPEGPFSIFTDYKQYLWTTDEACLYPDTLIPPNTYQRKRLISRWVSNGGALQLNTSYAGGCLSSDVLDSLVARKQIEPTVYAVDSVVQVDAKGISYTESITYYYRTLGSKGLVRPSTIYYSYDDGGYLVVGSPFLGEYRLYY